MLQIFLVLSRNKILFIAPLMRHAINTDAVDKVTCKQSDASPLIGGT